MKFNFRKITSALASSAMFGTTVALAAAASFPAPFVQNGAADVAIVYGNALDLVAVTDISTALSSALATGSSTGVVTNDAYALFTSSTPLQINNSIASVRASVTESNLPAVLGDTEFSGNVDATAVFQIVPGPNRITFAKQPTSSDEPTLAVTMGTSGTSSPFYLYNATTTFNKAVNFTHADSEGEEIVLFGQTFTIGSATDDDELVLFKAAETIQLSVGGTTSVPTQTVEVGGDTYTIELVSASDTSATIRVTNSAGTSDQKEINEAASKKINGLEVSVNNADESTATNIIQAEVVVGASRIKLQNNAAVLMGTDDDTIDGTKAYFANGPYPGNITKITVSVFAPDSSSDAIQVGESYTDPVFGSFRLAFSDDSVEEGDWETISVQASGTEKVSFGFTNWQDKELSSFEFVNNKSGEGLSTAYLGDDDWSIFVQEMATINESAYAMVGNEDDGYLVKLRTLTNGTSDYSNDKVVLENVFDSTDTWTASLTEEGVGTVQIGSKSYTVTYVYDTTASNSDQKFVRLNDGDSSADNMILYPTIETSKGAKLSLYEPLTIDLDNWDGSAEVDGFMLPDGDGYTTIAASTGVGGSDLSLNWTIGSSVLQVNDTSRSVNATVGQFTYAFIGAGDADGSTNKTKVQLLDPRSGARIEYPSVVVFEEKDESNNYEALIIQTSGAGTSTSGMGVGDTDFTWNNDNDFSGAAWGTSGLQSESNDDIYKMMDQWGTIVTTDQSDSDQYTVDVSYPDEQVTALLYVDSLAEGSGTTTLGDVKVMDDELASSGMSGKNLIVVGGSCVNTAASTLLGGSAGCGASWTAATGAGSGEWIIQSFANPWASSKIATLVAGWEQGDTANAATYLKTQNPKTDKDHKLTGTTATAATVVTA